MLQIILFAPLIASILAGFFYKQLGERFVIFLAITLLFISAIKVLRISLPSSDFIGMFCKFGSLEASLPVEVAANRKEV